MTKQVIRKQTAATARKVKSDEPVATKLAALPKSFADIRMSKNSKTTVQDVVERQRLKLAKSVSDQLSAYVELGKAMIVAKAAIKAAGGRWDMFMQDKPLGIGRSTADRYQKIAEIGADKLLAAHQKRAIEAAKAGEDAPLNVKQLISDVNPPKTKGPDQPAKTATVKAMAPNRPAVTVADLPPPATSVSDEWVDSTIDSVFPSLTEAQAERLALALRARIEELHERVIEGEAEAA